MVKIEDMAVSLILEEWGCQNLARRNLSRDSRQENYGNVFSQGKTDTGFVSDDIVLPFYLLVVGSLMYAIECDKDLKITDLCPEQRERTFVFV
jgi:hypothetical protein